MGRVPLIAPPITGQSQSPNVRVDPGMGNGLAAAQQHVAAGLDQWGDLAHNVKTAKDTAFVVGAQAQMEAEQRDFHAWTLQNPDTATWQEELDHRMKTRTDQINKDATDQNVSSHAMLQLGTDINAWRTRTTSFAGQLKTEQDIKNSAGVMELSLRSAIAGNDVVGANAIIDTGRAQGVFSSAHATALKKSVTVGIATNQANADIEDDVFTAVDRLTAKGDDGTHANYQGLPEANRVNLITKANRLAAQTRANTLRTWAGMVEAAQNAQTPEEQAANPMPDRDGLMAEAQRQGIKPSEVDKLLEPVHYDATKAADISSRILSPSYSPMTDPHADLTRANFEAEIYAAHFPAPTRDRLLKALDQKNDPLHVYNSPVFKEAMQANDYNFAHEVYGKFETSVRNPKTGEYSTVINQGALARAKATQAKVTDALVDYVQRHPPGTPGSSQKEIQQYIRTVYSGVIAQAGAALFKFNP